MRGDVAVGEDVALKCGYVAQFERGDIPAGGLRLYTRRRRYCLVFRDTKKTAGRQSFLGIDKLDDLDSL